MKHYCPTTNSRRCYELAIAACRELGVREGRFEPQNEQERRWAAEGVRPVENVEAGR